MKTPGKLREDAATHGAASQHGRILYMRVRTGGVEGSRTLESTHGYGR